MELAALLHDIGICTILKCLSLLSCLLYSLKIANNFSFRMFTAGDYKYLRFALTLASAQSSDEHAIWFDIYYTFYIFGWYKS